MDSLFAALSCLLLVAGIRESWSFSVGPALNGVVPSSCPIKNGDVLEVRLIVNDEFELKPEV